MNPARRFLRWIYRLLAADKPAGLCHDCGGVLGYGETEVCDDCRWYRGIK